MLVPMNTSHGEAKLHEAFIASMMVKSWKLLFYPILSSDSGYLETSEPGELLRKMWLAEHTRTKTTLWRNMPDSVVECWKKIRQSISGIPTAVFEHASGDMIAVQKLDFLRDPNSVRDILQSSNTLMVEMPTLFFTEQEFADDPHTVLAWVLKAVHTSDIPEVVQLGGKTFVISK